MGSLGLAFGSAPLPGGGGAQARELLGGWGCVCMCVILVCVFVRGVCGGGGWAGGWVKGGGRGRGAMVVGTSASAGGISDKQASTPQHIVSRMFRRRRVAQRRRNRLPTLHRHTAGQAVHLLRLGESGPRKLGAAHAGARAIS